MKSLKKLFSTGAATLAMFAVFLSACGNPAAVSPTVTGSQAGTAPTDQLILPTESDDAAALREIYLAGGCFWGTEGYFQRIPGIVATDVGYANGDSDETSYEEIARSGHAETVHITYDPDVIHLAEILDRFYLAIDPLAVDRQGNDIGRQYRSGIYWTDDFSAEVAALSLSLLNERLGQNSAIELAQLQNYVLAEDYHQDYLAKNPTGYCHINLALAREQLYPVSETPSAEELREKLSPDVYDVTQEQGTEAPFSSPLNDLYEPGIYVDIVTGQALFSSADKFSSGTGWPSFTKPITTDSVTYRRDLNTFDPTATEIQNNSETSHLGHVFRSMAAEEGGLRYCINGVSLRFVPEAEMRDEGYAHFLPYVLEETDGK